MERYTTVTLGRFPRKDAERLVDTLRASMVNSFLQPCEIGAAPAWGECEVSLTTRYVFADDEGNDLDETANQAKLADHMLYVLSCELVR
jgi:hypothetical protein